jgi:poly(3-hydroxybutyrate) depolymerase
MQFLSIKKVFKYCITSAVIVVSSAGALFSAPSDEMLAGSVKLSNNKTMYFRLYVPKNISTDKRYPLVMCLHGIGERGSDNRAQVDREDMARQWSFDSVKTKYSPFVLYPQCPADDEWVNYMGNGGDGKSAPAAVGAIKVIDSLIKKYPIDTTRLYVGGLSWGGMGTQGILMTYPKKFAAAFPCASMNTVYTGSILKQTPFWAWHGSNDPTVNVSGSKNLCNAVEKEGEKVVRFVSGKEMSKPSGISVDSLKKAVAAGASFLYSEVTGGDHGAGWHEAFYSPILVPWLMSKSKVDGKTITTWPPEGPKSATSITAERLNRFHISKTIQVTNGKIFWQSFSNFPASLAIFNAKGSIVKQYTVQNSQGEVSCAELPSGIYVAKFNVSGKISSGQTLVIAQ